MDHNNFMNGDYHLQASQYVPTHKMYFSYNL